MSGLTETSLSSMKLAFPSAPDPIQRIPTFALLIDMMLHICRFLQTHKTPALTTMNMLFRATSPGLYLFFTNKNYQSSFFRFRPKLKPSRSSQPAHLTMSARARKLPKSATKKPELTLLP